MPGTTTDSPVRRAVLRLVVSVLVLDAIAVAVYFLGGLTAAEPRTRVTFAAVWTVASLIAVLIGLRQVREARATVRRR
jgi:hypothetical protein